MARRRHRRRGGRRRWSLEPRRRRRSGLRLKEQLDKLAAQREINDVLEEGEYLDIVGGVSPVTIKDASPLMSIGKVGDAVSRSSSESDEGIELKKQLGSSAEQIRNKIVPVSEEEDAHVDICGGATPLGPPEKVEISRSSDSNSSSSDSDSDCSDTASCSDSESDESVNSPASPSAVPKDIPPPTPEPAFVVAQSTEPESLQDENVNSPAPPAIEILPEQNVTAQEPASEVAQSARPELLQDQRSLPASSMSRLIARARESRDIRRQERSGWEWEKARRDVRTMVGTALLDESIAPRELMRIGISEYMVSTVRPRPDAGGRLRAPRCTSVLQRLGFFLKAEYGDDEL